MTQANIHSETSHGAHAEHGHGDEPHVLPISVYLAVWGALVMLTAITVVVSRFDFGSANTFVALLVATIKGSLVALYFMHLRYDNKLNLIILVSSLLFVSIFFTPTLIDLSTRGAIDPVKAHRFFKLNTAQPVPLPAVAAPAAPTPPAPAPPAAPAQPGAAPAQPAAPAAPAAAPAPKHH